MSWQAMARSLGLQRCARLVASGRSCPDKMGGIHMEDPRRRACETIWHLWQEGEVINCLPEDLRPGSRREGYAIQAGLEAFSTKPRYGWKIDATSLAGQQHIGVDQPLAGRLLAERVLADGSVVSIAGNRMRVAEPEFAFRLARDLEPRSTPYDVSEVMAAVDDLHLCLELPDSRFRDFARVGGACRGSVTL